MLHKKKFLLIILSANLQAIFAMNIQRCSLFCLPIEIQRLIYTFLTKDRNPISLTQISEVVDGKDTTSLELKIKTLSGPITKKHVFSKKRKREEPNERTNIIKIKPRIFFNPENTELTFSVEANSCNNKDCDVCYFGAEPTRNKVISCTLPENKQTGICCFANFDLSDVYHDRYIIENNNADKGIIYKESAKETDPFFTFSNEEITLIENSNGPSYNGNPLREYFYQMAICKQ